MGDRDGTVRIVTARIIPAMMIKAALLNSAMSVIFWRMLILTAQRSGSGMDMR